MTSYDPQLEAQARDLVVAAIGVAGNVEDAARMLHTLLDHVIGAKPDETKPPIGTPDADGLIRIAALDDFARQLRAKGRGDLAALMVPERAACQAGLDQIPAGSDLWHIVRTEMAWAALNDAQTPFGNPSEILKVNRYRVHADPGLPTWRRLERLPFDYIPHALAFGPRHKTAADVVTEVKRRVRYALESVSESAPGVDFSPLPPLP